MLKVEKFVVNPLQENTYVLYDETGECIFIDPGFYFEVEKDEIRKFVAEKNLKPVFIANTHCHFDHIMGVEFIRNEYKIPFYAHADDEYWIKSAIDQAQLFGFNMDKVNLPESFFTANNKIEFGQSSLEIIHVPGHSPGHVAFYSKEADILIGGDVLFYGSIGRTDLPGGDFDTLISSIKDKLFGFSDKTTIYCGHGPETSLGFEKNTNPFLT